ncbi:MAG: ATP-dependent zinc metalloprotease FtsH, partial [Acidimicrobiales bacterium]
MAATNRPDILDRALVRPGRFDRQVDVSLPDRAGRRAILAVHARNKRIGADVDLDRVAVLTQGFSGADLAGVLNEAALLATRQSRPAISMPLVDEAIDRVSMGVASRGTLLSDEERRVVAFHEAGHALVAVALFGDASLHKLTIVPRPRSLGHCSVVDEVDRALFSRDRLVNQMAWLLGGREAEELEFGQPSTGAAGDLERVGQVARRMVCEFGMSSAVGPLPFVEGQGRRRWSEQTARVIDAEVRHLADEAAARARDTLTSRSSVLNRLALALLEHETLTAQEIAVITGTGDGVLQGGPPTS